MQHHVSPATHYSHLDILAGRWARIPLGFLPERQPQILSAMMRSRELGGTAALFEDRFLLEVDFSYDGAGVAALGLASHVAMGEGIEPRTRLFFGTCAASPIFSDEIYGSVGRYYLNAMLCRPKWRMPSLPGEFPAEHPWAASFLYPEAARQSWQ